MRSAFGGSRRPTTQLQWQRFSKNHWTIADGSEIIDQKPTTPVIAALCRYFDCSPSHLHRMLLDPFNRWLAVQLLRTKKIRTTHLKDGRNFTVKFGMLTRKNSRQLMAYGGFLRITVQQHFYARHRIYLRHSNLPCLCMFGWNHRRTYLPLELLEIL